MFWIFHPLDKNERGGRRGRGNTLLGSYFRSIYYLLFTIDVRVYSTDLVHDIFSLLFFVLGDGLFRGKVKNEKENDEKKEINT